MPPKLTARTVLTVKAPQKGRLELWDTIVPGLMLRVTPGGSKAWTLRYRSRGRRRRLGIGQPWRSGEPVTSLRAARELARDALAQLRHEKVDPAAVRAAARKADTVAALGDEFIQSREARAWRAKTRKEFVRIVEREINPALGTLPAHAVTKADVRRLVDRIFDRAPTMANRVLGVLRLLYAWAIEHERIETSPAWPRPPAEERKRARVLTERELRAVWNALDHTPEVDISEPQKSDVPRVGYLLSCAFKLMLLTAQRRGQVLHLRWGDLAREADGLWWNVPADFTKGGRAHIVPLSMTAAEVLEGLRPLTGDGEWVFPSPHKGKGPIRNPQKAAGRLWTLIGLKGSAHVHDLRRTAASYMTAMQIPRVVVGKILAHAEREVTGTTYDIYAYAPQMRTALEAWARRLHRIALEGESAGEVVPLIRA